MKDAPISSSSSQMYQNYFKKNNKDFYSQPNEEKKFSKEKKSTNFKKSISSEDDESGFSSLDEPSSENKISSIENKYEFLEKNNIDKNIKPESTQLTSSLNQIASENSVEFKCQSLNKINSKKNCGNLFEIKEININETDEETIEIKEKTEFDSSDKNIINNSTNVDLTKNDRSFPYKRSKSSNPPRKSPVHFLQNLVKPKNEKPTQTESSFLFSLSSSTPTNSPSQKLFKRTFSSPNPSESLNSSGFFGSLNRFWKGNSGGKFLNNTISPIEIKNTNHENNSNLSNEDSASKTLPLYKKKSNSEKNSNKAFKRNNSDGNSKLEITPFLKDQSITPSLIFKFQTKYESPAFFGQGLVDLNRWSSLLYTFSKRENQWFKEKQENMRNPEKEFEEKRAKVKNSIRGLMCYLKEILENIEFPFLENYFLKISVFPYADLITTSSYLMEHLYLEKERKTMADHVTKVGRFFHTMLSFSPKNNLKYMGSKKLPEMRKKTKMNHLFEQGLNSLISSLDSLREYITNLTCQQLTLVI